ncbi:MAG: GNAT family N-acetyltransferase [Bacteroidota bacterium]
MDSIEIKQVSIRDSYEVMSQMMRKLHEHEFQLFDKTASWDDIEESYMRHIIAQQEENEGLCLVAYVDAEPAGFIFGYVEEQDDSRIEIYKGRELYVSDGYIYEDHRRKGIYSKLNRALEDHYVGKDVKRIVRFTRVNNVRMRDFMEKEGYMVTRLLYEKWL